MERDELATVILQHRPKLDQGVTRCSCGQLATLAARAASSDELARVDWAEHLAAELALEVDRYLEDVAEECCCE